MVTERRQATSRAETLESLGKSAAWPLQQQQNRTDMITAADVVSFQQQLGQDMTDVKQQLRAEMNETANGRIDMLSSINTALQNVSATSFLETGKAATTRG